MARRVIPASASIRTVCKPARAVKVAALDPAGPPPTMATSNIRKLSCGTMRPGAYNTRASQKLPAAVRPQGGPGPTGRIAALCLDDTNLRLGYVFRAEAL